MLVAEPMRAGLAGGVAGVGVGAAARLAADIDARMEPAAARPVIVPDTMIDGGKVFSPHVHSARATGWVSRTAAGQGLPGPQLQGDRRGHTFFINTLVLPKRRGLHHG